MTAPTLPEPRPDDEGRETAGPVTMSEVNVYAAAYLHYVRAGLDDRADVFALREAYWAAYQKLSDRLAALTPHPAPLGATDKGLRARLTRVLDTQHTYSDATDWRAEYERLCRSLRAALQAGATS